MIPSNIAALADALQDESMDLSRDHAIEIAYAIAAHLKKAGYEIGEPSS